MAGELYKYSDVVYEQYQTGEMCVNYERQISHYVDGYHYTPSSGSGSDSTTSDTSDTSDPDSDSGDDGPSYFFRSCGDDSINIGNKQCSLTRISEALYDYYRNNPDQLYGKELLVAG